jgi:alpha-tubulin suppressor-like RCC1 family protein
VARASGAVFAAALMMGAVGVAAPAWAAGPGGVTPDIRGALAFGSNSNGQLGDGTTVSHDTPVEPLGLRTGVRQVSAGFGHTLALHADGTVDAWGSNSTGQLGDGTLDTFFVPHPVPGLAGVKQVAAGGAHSLALTTDGTVLAWGANSHGQLGDGTLTERRKPVRVSGLTGIVQVAAGFEYSLAVRGDGKVMAWGANSKGQLGDGSIADRRLPVQVFGLAGVIQVAAGRNHSLALRSDGLAFSWGSNAGGALGDNTFVDHVTPIQVPVLADVAQVAAGDFFSAFLINGGVVQWGQEACGGTDVGDGPHNVGDGGECDTHRSAQFLTVDIRGATQLSAAGDHSAAILGDGTLWTWKGSPSPATPNSLTPIQIPVAADPIQVDVGETHTVLVVDRPPANAP